MSGDEWVIAETLRSYIIEGRDQDDDTRLICIIHDLIYCIYTYMHMGQDKITITCMTLMVLCFLIYLLYLLDSNGCYGEEHFDEVDTIEFIHTYSYGECVNAPMMESIPICALLEHAEAIRDIGQCCVKHDTLECIRCNFSYKNETWFNLKMAVRWQGAKFNGQTFNFKCNGFVEQTRQCTVDEIKNIEHQVFYCYKKEQFHDPNAPICTLNKNPSCFGLLVFSNLLIVIMCICLLCFCCAR
jgi:Ca2+/Na+ antiporter